jgi:hypothetical protein
MMNWIGFYNLLFNTWSRGNQSRSYGGVRKSSVVKKNTTTSSGAGLLDRTYPGGQQFESLRARQMPIFSNKNLTLGRIAMQNKKFCMTSAWLHSNLLAFGENCETVSAIQFQPRLPMP